MLKDTAGGVDAALLDAAERADGLHSSIGYGTAWPAELEFVKVKISTLGLSIRFSRLRVMNIRKPNQCLH